MQLPELYSIDEVAAVLGAAGFEASASRLKIGFVPASGHTSASAPELARWIEYYADHKLLLRCKRPSTTAS